MGSFVLQGYTSFGIPGFKENLLGVEFDGLR